MSQLMFFQICRVKLKPCNVISPVTISNIRYLNYFKIWTENYCTSNRDDHIPEKVNEDINDGIKLPEAPQDCCMSGCANCVWIAYAEELASIFKDDGATAKQKIMEHVKDPNLRSFLFLELGHIFKK